MNAKQFRKACTFVFLRVGRLPVRAEIAKKVWTIADPPGIDTVPPFLGIDNGLAYVPEGEIGIPLTVGEPQRNGVLSLTHHPVMRVSSPVKLSRIAHDGEESPPVWMDRIRGNLKPRPQSPQLRQCLWVKPESILAESIDAGSCKDEGTPPGCGLDVSVPFPNRPARPSQ